MRRSLIPFVIALGLNLTFVALDAKAEIRFSAGIEINATSDFYSPLSAEGSWVDVPSYGRCWHPRVASGWRPYTSGHWEWTDVGWYWVSDEPWSWACYHYGSWNFDPAYGWVWIPGTEWAPAWVTWRESPDYIGWAPCGPRGVVLAPSLFVFVQAGHFREHLRPERVIVNNTTIINRTTVVNNFRRETRTIEGTPQTVVINQGPRRELVERSSGGQLNPVPVTQVVHQTPTPSTVKRAPSRDRAITEQRGPAAAQAPASMQPQQQIAPDQPRSSGAVPKQTEQKSPPAPETALQAPQRPPTQPALPPTGSEKGIVSDQPRSSAVVPKQAERKSPPQPALPPTGSEKGYPNRELVVPPPTKAAPPARAPGKNAGPPPKGPPAEKENGRGHDKDKDKDRD